MYAVDTNGLKHHYLDLMQPYSYDTGDTQTLEIAYTSTGLHDLHQDYSLGNGDVDWIERKRTELEQELGREIYALFQGVVYVDAAFFISQHKKVGSHMELKKLCGFADVNINNV